MLRLFSVRASSSPFSQSAPSGPHSTSPLPFFPPAASSLSSSPSPCLTRWPVVIFFVPVEFAGLPYLCSAFSHRSRLTLPPVADENSQFVQRKAFNSCPQFIVSFLCIHVAEKLSVLGHFRTLLGHFGTPVLLLHLSLVGASCKLITGSTHPTNKWIGLLKASVF